MLLQSDLQAFSARIREELLETLDVLEDMVSPLCDGLRESFTEGTIEIDEEGVELTSPTEGEVQIDFDGYVSAGCRDIDGPEFHQRLFPFTIDPKGILTLTADYPEERDSDTY